MKNTEKHINELLELEPSSIISLYKINLKDKGDYLFHAGENGYRKKIVFDGQSYDFYPIKVDGFDMQAGGGLPRPRMTFSNYQGNISMRLDFFEDFTNYKVTRIKTFVKFIDKENFPNNINPHEDPDPDASFTEDVFFVNQKVKEDDAVVEFELVSLLELENANIPARVVYSNNCPWVYRSDIGCRYTGKPISDNKNKRFVPSGYNEIMVGENVYFEDEFDAEEFAPGTDYNEWTINNIYSKGDVVKTTPFDYDPSLNPSSIYVCVKDNTRSNPIFDRESWRLDECDKTICGCRLRFSDISAEESGGGKRQGEDWIESNKGLPFGGFPGIEPYEFK